MRILHLIDQPRRDRAGRTGGGCEAVDACLRLGRGAGDEHTICLIGEASFARMAGAGPDAHRIGAPAGRPWLAQGALRSLVSRIPTPDVLHAWSLPALHLARAAFGGEIPRTGSLLTEWRADEIAIECTGTPVAVVSDSLRSRCIAAGVPSERIVLTPPPYSPSPILRSERDELRRSLGIDAADGLVLHLGFDPFADAVRFVTILTMLDLAGRTTVGLISEHSAQTDRAKRLYRSLNPRARLLVTDRPTTAFVGAADAALYDGGAPALAGRIGQSGAAVVPVAAAAARGVPVVIHEALLSDLPKGIAHIQPCPGETTAALANSLSLALGRPKTAPGASSPGGGNDPEYAFAESVSRMWRLACARSAVGAAR